MARTSARPSIPSSPPKFQSQTPVAKRTRSARENSVDLDAKNNQTDSRRGRNARQGSVDNQQKGGRETRATAAVAKDLPPVTEVEESESESEDVDDNEIQDGRHRASSPTDTDYTSWTEGQLQELDPDDIKNALPDLYYTACRLLELAANGNAIKPKDLDRRLNAFELQLKYFGDSVNFIANHIVLRKFFGDEHPLQKTNLSPTLHAANLAILVKQVTENRRANVTILDKQRTSETLQDITTFFQRLERLFPRSFVDDFSDQSRCSELAEETFKVGLGIRIHKTILSFRQLEDDPSFDPDEFLKSVFFEDESLKIIDGVSPRAISLEKQASDIMNAVKKFRSAFKPAEKATGKGQYVDYNTLNDLFPLASFYNTLVQYGHRRFLEIKKDIDDHGGIEKIMKDIPEEEEEEPIEANYQPSDQKDSTPETGSISGPKSPNRVRGNPEALKRLMALTAKNAHRNVESLPEQNISPNISSPPQQRPESEVVNSAPLMKEVHKADKLKPLAGSHWTTRPNPNGEKVVWDGDSQQGLPEATKKRKRDRLSSNYAEKSEHNKRQKRSDEVAESETEDQAQITSQNARKAAVLQAQSSAPFKEPEILRSREHSPEALGPEDEQGEQPEISEREKSMQSPVNSSSSSSQGFQEDKRTPRKPAPQANPKPNQSRPRPSGESVTLLNESNDEDEDQVGVEHRKRGEARRQIPSQSRRQALPQPRRESTPPRDDLEDYDDISDDDDGEIPPPRFSSTAGMARANTISRTQYRYKTQTRTPWSDHDSDLLIRLIGEFGCRWALIESRGGFERDIDQIALKDKARNIKVAYVKSQWALPENFEDVPLGAKEIKTIRVLMPDYQPDWR